ncbi:MAG: PIN domain-containing protein [Candidatus Saccharimonadales bacterium]
MKLFLDSSVVLAACGRATGASRALFDMSGSQTWTLLTSSYVLGEVTTNLPRLAPAASCDWPALRGKLEEVPDVISFQWASIMAPAKDRPILFTAAAWSDILLTLDRRDFAELLGGTFYGLPILKPGDFLQRERAAGRLSD